jgi:hypothetical protein
MGAGDKLNAHRRRLGSNDRRKYLIQHRPPQVAMTITRHTGEMMYPNPVLPEGA